MQIIFKLLILTFTTSIFAAMITGNQGKVCVTGGSIDVSSGGVTQTVNSGEITFMGDGQAPSKPRKIQKGDLNDVYDDLKASENIKTVNLKYAPVKYKVAKQIRLKLIKKGFKRKFIKIRKYKNLSQLWLLKVDINKIRTLYPPYYKAAKSFFRKKSNKRKTPTLTIQLSHLKRYHKRIFRKYDK